MTRTVAPRNFTWRIVLAALMAMLLVLLATGCGKPKSLNEVSNETFGPWLSKMPGMSLSFTEPATVIFSMSSSWNELSPDEQTNFIHDAGDTWERAASGRAETSEIRVVVEDSMGNVTAIYQAGKGISRGAP